MDFKEGDIVTYYNPKNKAVEWEQFRYKFKVIRVTKHELTIEVMQHMKAKTQDDYYRWFKGDTMQLEKFKFRKVITKYNDHFPKWF